MKLVISLVVLSACGLDPGDREDIDLTSADGAEQCRERTDYPCGWVYFFQGSQIELCLPWDDRVLLPNLFDEAEAVHGYGYPLFDAQLGGYPLCLYRCPSNDECVAAGGCFCP